MMISEVLQKARDFESQYGPHIPDSERPAFHVTPTIGWMNDPNGFSVYKGEYHLFYQYYPYSSEWGLMHWGHLKSKDLIRWERLPAALAPDQEYDAAGCFSGGAVELPDGRQLLMYTGVRRSRNPDGFIQEIQTQCVAVGDGTDYEKFSGNPILDAKDLPEGGSAIDFRDQRFGRKTAIFMLSSATARLTAAARFCFIRAWRISGENLSAHWTPATISMERCGSVRTSSLWTESRC